MLTFVFGDTGGFAREIGATNIFWTENVAQFVVSKITENVGSINGFSDTNATRSYDTEGSEQLFAVSFNGRSHYFCLSLLRLACQAYEYDAFSYPALTEYHFPKIFISGQ